jgi:chorismate mutase
MTKDVCDPDRPPRPQPPAASDLERLRLRIDAIDDRIVALLDERAALARQAGRAKAALGMPVLDPVREKSLLARLGAAKCDNLGEGDVASIYREVLAVMRKAQGED